MGHSVSSSTHLEALPGRRRGRHVEEPRRLGGRRGGVLRRVALSQPRPTAAAESRFQTLGLIALLEIGIR